MAKIEKKYLKNVPKLPKILPFPPSHIIQLLYHHRATTPIEYSKLSNEIIRNTFLVKVYTERTSLHFWRDPTLWPWGVQVTNLLSEGCEIVVPLKHSRLKSFRI